MRVPISSWAAICLFAFALLSGCSDLAATNPYDPRTPAAQQATGRIVGRVRMPDRFRESRLEGNSVKLLDLSAPEDWPGAASSGRFFGRAPRRAATATSRCGFRARRL